MTPRTIVWFSAGAASAVAAKLTLADIPDAVIAYVNPGSEHPDNERFLTDCEAWFGRSIVRLRSDRYVDTWQVWTERRFLVGPTGALCTAELKKKVRFGFERPDDRQVFGYTAEERHRADRFREQNPGVDLVCPLIDRELRKADCLALIERAGIPLPTMYLLGFQNNNCVGCPKGGMGYWNHIRRHFPDVFDRMAGLERELGHSILKDPTGPIWLDGLDPDRGELLGEPDIDCSLMCALAEGDI
jgi:hypothetical protein